MSRYEPLRWFLAKQPAERREVRLTFTELERLVGSLPASARNQRTWWGNSTHGQSLSWQAAGWIVDTVNLTAEHVAFIRGHAQRRSLAAPVFVRQASQSAAPGGIRGNAPMDQQVDVELVGGSDGQARTVASTTTRPIVSSQAEVGDADPAAAFGTLLSFLAKVDLTQRISVLEHQFQGVDRQGAQVLLAESGLGTELLVAALLVRRHAGRLSDLIHAAVISQVLPLILEDGERVLRRPSLASGNDPGRPYDLETNRRVAEFKVSMWKGADAMRKRTAFADLVNLTLDESGRRAQLYVAGPKAIKFLRTGTSPVRWGLDRASPQLRQRYEARFGSLDLRICDFTAGQAAHVELIDLTDLMPALTDITNDPDTKIN